MSAVLVHAQGSEILATKENYYYRPLQKYIRHFGRNVGKKIIEVALSRKKIYDTEK